MTLSFSIKSKVHDVCPSVLAVLQHPGSGSLCRKLPPCHPLCITEELCRMQSPLLGISPKPPSQRVAETLAHQCSQQLCYGTKRGSTKEQILETRCWKHGIATQWHCFQGQRRMKSGDCRKMETTYSQNEASIRETNVMYSSHLQFLDLQRYLKLHMYA